ncbi:NAD-dependent epimerase/dehydratase family protein [Ideonella azotifigens]|nr:NAD-dependent epimerase/dehydratase family protein [Ideonella azotifigens]MCD2340395.1 NAD-dependent epimerase/dehydratase family protein [Ideonella azotifigens]
MSGARMAPLALAITGATGFTGSALLRRLAAEPPGSVSARALVRGEGSRVASACVTPVIGALPALADGAAEQLFPAGPHVLVHLANHNVGDAASFEAVNVEGTRRLLAALPASCQGIVYGSSLSVLGQAAQEGVDELAPVAPQTALAHSRLAAEQLVLAAAQARGIGAYLLRPRFVLGRGDAATLPGLLRLARRGLALGSGAQRWSVIDVDDYANIMLRLCHRLQAGSQVRGPLHIGYARPISFDEVRSALGEAFALPPVRRRVPVSGRVTRLMSSLPLAGLRRLATQLELVGLSHFSATDRLQAEVGTDLLAKDPRAVVAQAARLLSLS